MPQFAYIALGILFGIKELFSNIKLDRKTKLIIIGIAIYFVVNNYIKQEQRKNALNNAPNNKNTSFAIRLYNAFHPYFDGGDWIPDGTDEEAVIQIAKEMKPYRNYYQVSLEYQKIYQRQLSADLSSEGVYTEFFQNYN